MHAGAVGEHARLALLEHRQRGRLADQLLARLAGERAEGVVGIGDVALRVAAHDQIALRLQQAARALFRLAQFPIAVGQFLDARLQPAQLLEQGAPAHQQEGDRRAGGGEQRADAGGRVVRIVIRAPEPDAGEEAERAGDHRDVVMAARPNSTSAALLRERARALRTNADDDWIAADWMATAWLAWLPAV